MAQQTHEVIIGVETIGLAGDLTVPDNPRGLIIFAHGSGSSRHSPRNRFVASVLQQAGFGTLLMDLLTLEEDELDFIKAHLRFNIPFLASRLQAVTEWVLQHPRLRSIPLGYFGASTGAAAALMASRHLPSHKVQAIVSRGGRPDMAETGVLREIHIPTLLIVGGEDRQVLKLNEMALKELAGPKKLIIIPGATHLFEEPGTLEAVAQHASSWFQHYLVGMYRPV